MEKYGGGGSDDTWAVDPLMVAGNAGYTYTIPSCLADGFYLVRHEIIAVFVASSYPGAQLYPGCHQLNVTGGGSTVPADLVAFPGAYAGTDPGITWDSSSTTYPIPGPTVLTCSGSSSSGGGSGSAASSAAASSSSSTTAPAAVETPAPAPATTLTTAVVASSLPAASGSAVAVAAASPEPSSSSSSSSAAAPTATADASSSKTCSKKRGLRRSRRNAVQE